MDPWLRLTFRTQCGGASCDMRLVTSIVDWSPQSRWYRHEGKRGQPAREEKAIPELRARRRRPRKNNMHEPKLKMIPQQLAQNLTEMVAALPQAYDCGTKGYAKIYKAR